MDRTCGDASSPSSRGANTPRSAVGDRGPCPVSSRNSAAARGGGDGLVARASRSRTAPARCPGAGRTLYGVSPVAQVRREPEDTGVRAVPLVRRREDRVTAERRGVDRPVRGEVHRVDEHPGAGRVRGVDDRGDVGDRAERVRRPGDRDPARPGPMRSTTASTVRRPVSRSNGVSSIVAPASSAASRHGVTLASWSSRVPTISSPGASVRPTRPGERERERRHVGPEHDPAGVSAEQLADRRRARRRPSPRSPGSPRSCPPPFALAPAQVVAHRRDRGVDHLRARRTVEAGPAVGQSREAIAHVGH